MAFKFLEEWAKKHRTAFYAHVRPWIGIGAAVCKATGRRITWEEHTGLIALWDGANSYERRLLFPLLDDEGLCRYAEYCMGQAGRELGELELPQHYNDAVEREIAPLLVKRLRESAGLLEAVRDSAKEWGQWRETIEHLKETATGQQKRADKLEIELSGAKMLAEVQRAEAAELRRQLEILKERRAAEGAELDEARREAARWEVQAQDLRDKLVQAGRLSPNEIAAARDMS